MGMQLCSVYIKKRSKQKTSVSNFDTHTEADRANVFTIGSAHWHPVRPLFQDIQRIDAIVLSAALNFLRLKPGVLKLWCLNSCVYLTQIMLLEWLSCWVLFER